MKHEPRPAILMEKQLGSAHTLGGTESQGVSRVGQTVLGRLLESQIWHLPVGSVALLAFLSGRKLSPSSSLDASHCCYSLDATGVFQAATWVLELRGSESE